MGKAIMYNMRISKRLGTQRAFVILQGSKYWIGNVFIAGWLALASSTIDVASAESLPPIPNPVGFVEASGLSDGLRASGTAGLLPSAKLLGLYYTTNTVADILNTGSASPAPFCKAVLQKEYKSLSDAEDGFRTLVNNAKKESGKRFDPDDKELKKILKYYEEVSRNTVAGRSAKVSGASMLGIIVENEKTFAISMLTNFGWSDGQSQINMPFAVALAFTRIGKRQVHVSVLYPFRDASSVSTANQKLSQWLDEIRERNKNE